MWNKYMRMIFTKMRANIPKQESMRGIKSFYFSTSFWYNFWFFGSFFYFIIIIIIIIEKYIYFFLILGDLIYLVLFWFIFQYSIRFGLSTIFWFLMHHISVSFLIEIYTFLLVDFPWDWHEFNGKYFWYGLEIFKFLFTSLFSLCYIHSIFNFSLHGLPLNLSFSTSIIHCTSESTNMYIIYIYAKQFYTMV